ncbi:hypothetical protein J4471_01925 [Candidatus Woesearchaeota archaeon]|nr:hypothetical protein [Candidatus Woesearchaeota archaeon]
MAKDRPECLEGVLMGFAPQEYSPYNIDFVLCNNSKYINGTFYAQGNTRQIYLENVLKVGQRIRFSNLSSGSYAEFTVLSESKDDKRV